jgi:hypothetical protein
MSDIVIGQHTQCVVKGVITLSNLLPLHAHTHPHVSSTQNKTDRTGTAMAAPHLETTNVFTPLWVGGCEVVGMNR